MREFQQHIDSLYGVKDRKRGTEGTFLWLSEEVGELAEALRKKDFFQAREEIADVLAWTVTVANLLGVDVEDAVREKYPLDRCGKCGKLPCACVE